jgi:uncharacterized protein with gpF-like domain
MPDKTPYVRRKRTMEGKAMLYPDVVGLRYWAELEPLFNAMTRETERELLALFDSPQSIRLGLATQDESLTKKAKAILSRLSRKYARAFEGELKKFVPNWIKNIDNSSKASIKRSLKELSNGVTVSPDFLTDKMAEQFKAMTVENVSLFKTIAAEYFPKVESAVMNSIISGNGQKDLVPFFESHSNGTKNYGRLRALDQTRKAYTSINLARMERLGVKKVKWLHSHGSNAPRKLHQDLDKKIFDIDKPPFIGVMYGVDVYGFGGVLPNCRCALSPVIELTA